MLLKEVTSIPLLDRVLTTRCFINSEKQKTPISIESLIAFLKEVVNQYTIKELYHLELEREELEYDVYEYYINCVIDIPSREQDISAYELYQKNEKDKRKSLYLSLKKEFEKDRECQ